MKHNWEYKKLGDICEILDSQRKPVTKTERVSGPYPYYGASGIQDYVHDYLFDGKYLLVGEDGAKWGSNEKSAFSVSGKIWVNNHAHVLDFASSPVKQNLIEYFLCFKDLNLYVKGAIIPKLNQQLLKAINVPIPPREEQERIVAELDKINEVIEECRELLRTLDSLAQSIFYDTFGDPISNPKGWPIRQISEIGEIERGTGISKKDFVANGSPCIHYGQLHTAFGPTAHKHLTCIPKNLLSKPKIAHPRDVIMAITSEDVEGSCKSTAWLGDYDIIVGSDAAILHHNQNGVYISYYTLTSAFSHEKAKYAKGFKVTHISSKEIGSIPIMVPPLSLQQQFAAQIEAIEAQKNAVEATISEMKTLLDSRMDYWFND